MTAAIDLGGLLSGLASNPDTAAVAVGTVAGVLSNLLTDVIKNKILAKPANKDKVIKIEIPLSDEPVAARVIQQQPGHILIEIDRTTYLVRETEIPEEISELLKLQKDEKLPEGMQISILKTDSISTAIETQKEYSEKVDSLPLGLNDYYRGLLLSVIDVANYYDSGNKKAGDRAKAEIRPIYGAKGTLFCNLYTQKYIPKALDYFVKSGGDLKTDGINTYLDIFVKYWDSVFFINRGHVADYYYPNFKSAILSKKDYIALHSISNANIETASKLLEKLKEEQIDLKAQGYELIPKEGITPTTIVKKDFYLFTTQGKGDFDLFQSI